MFYTDEEKKPEPIFEHPTFSSAYPSTYDFPYNYGHVPQQTGDSAFVHPKMTPGYVWSMPSNRHYPGQADSYMSPLSATIQRNYQSLPHYERGMGETGVRAWLRNHRWWPSSGASRADWRGYPGFAYVPSYSPPGSGYDPYTDHIDTVRLAEDRDYKRKWRRHCKKRKVNRGCNWLLRSSDAARAAAVAFLILGLMGFVAGLGYGIHYAVSKDRNNVIAEGYMSFDESQWKEAYTNSQSEEFKAFEDLFCEAVEESLLDNNLVNNLIRCTILRLSKGSVLVNFTLEIRKQFERTPEEIAAVALEEITIESEKKDSGAFKNLSRSTKVNCLRLLTGQDCLKISTPAPTRPRSSTTASTSTATSTTKFETTIKTTNKPQTSSLTSKPTTSRKTTILETSTDRTSTMEVKVISSRSPSSGNVTSTEPTSSTTAATTKDRESTYHSNPSSRDTASTAGETAAGTSKPESTLSFSVSPTTELSDMVSSRTEPPSMPSSSLHIESSTPQTTGNVPTTKPLEFPLSSTEGGLTSNIPTTFDIASSTKLYTTDIKVENTLGQTSKMEQQPSTIGKLTSPLSLTSIEAWTAAPTVGQTFSSPTLPPTLQSTQMTSKDQTSMTSNTEQVPTTVFTKSSSSSEQNQALNPTTSNPLLSSTIQSEEPPLHSTSEGETSLKPQMTTGDLGTSQATLKPSTRDEAHTSEMSTQGTTQKGPSYTSSPAEQFPSTAILSTEKEKASTETSPTPSTGLSIIQTRQSSVGSASQVPSSLQPLSSNQPTTDPAAPPSTLPPDTTVINPTTEQQIPSSARPTSLPESTKNLPTSSNGIGTSAGIDPSSPLEPTSDVTIPTTIIIPSTENNPTSQRSPVMTQFTSSASEQGSTEKPTTSVPSVNSTLASVQPTTVGSPCASGPCYNGGTCMEKQNGTTYTCLCALCGCANYFTGDNCEIDLTTCDGHPGADVYVPDPFDCKNYSRCVNGVLWPQTCQTGLVYNPFTKLCDFPYNLNCSQMTYTSEPLAITAGPSTVGLSCADVECQNNGTCEDQANGYKCLCPYGCKGSLCQTCVDPCESNPCQNNATCSLTSDGLDFICDCGYTCQCANEVSKTCSINLATCENSPAVGAAFYPHPDDCNHYVSCHNGGEWERNVKCAEGKVASMDPDVSCTSQVPECHPSYFTQNPQSTVFSPPAPQSMISLDIRTTRTVDLSSIISSDSKRDTKMTSFESLPADITTKASSSQNVFPTTDSDDNACRSNPCKNGGTCFDRGNSSFSCLCATCGCASYFTGDECQTDLTTCDDHPGADVYVPDPFDCKNYSRCVNGVLWPQTCQTGLVYNPFTKLCDFPYNLNCSQIVHTTTSQAITAGPSTVGLSCADVECQNNGTCEDQANGYKCLCPYGCKGSLCQTCVDPCESNPCQNNATCSLTSDGLDFICDCGYTCQCANEVSKTCSINLATCENSPAVGAAFYPHPDDCNHYVSCHNGGEWERNVKCAEGKVASMDPDVSCTSQVPECHPNFP